VKFVTLTCDYVCMATCSNIYMHHYPHTLKGTPHPIVPIRGLISPL